MTRDKTRKDELADEIMFSVKDVFDSICESPFVFKHHRCESHTNLRKQLRCSSMSKSFIVNKEWEHLHRFERNIKEDSSGSGQLVTWTRTSHWVLKSMASVYQNIGDKQASTVKGFVSMLWNTQNWKITSFQCIMLQVIWSIKAS